MIDLNDIKKHYDGRPAAVFGLGVSGMSSTVALLESGFDVLVWDDREDQREKAKDYGAKIHDLTSDMPKDTAFLVLAPGVPLTHPAPHPVVKKAQSLGIEILSDIELLHRAKPDTKTIGITGTNGKSTTTALIGHILKQAGKTVEVGGNLGLPALAFNDVGDDGIYVIELSSYQLDLCPTFKPDISILLNITPDHLDRHGGIDGYAKAKSRIFGNGNTAICSIDDQYCKNILADAASAKKISISLTDIGAEIFVKDNILFDGDQKVELQSIPNLKGAHNHQNIMAAYAACRAAGLSVQEIEDGLHSFPGLEHRQKAVRTIDGITFVNDSKATNDEATAKALSSFHNIYWIAGGQAKGPKYPESAKYFDRIRHAYLIGEGADDLATECEKYNVANTHSKILHAAVFKAYEDALADIKQNKTDKAVVLLSPACASWDQFNNFEQRGQVFIECVNYLPNKLPNK